MKRSEGGTKVIYIRGNHDDFLKPLGDAKLKEFKVFNRWGNMVFSTDDPNTLGWDGSYNGKQQEIGVYV